MKTKIFNKIAFFVIILSCFFVSCEKDVDYNHSIIITTNSPYVSFWIGGTNFSSIEVNWGNGNIEKYTSKTLGKALEFRNPDLLPKTIIITGLVTSFNCDYNELTTLDVSNNNVLKRLDCVFAKLTSLDISKNTSLEILKCGKNLLTNLDLSKNPKLTILGCESNQLTNLDVSKNIELNSLFCGNNLLTSLNVSKNAKLAGLACNDNQLTSLDVSKNAILEGLGCNDNQLTSLDVSKNTALRNLSCIGNQLTTATLNAFFNTLHSNNFPSKFIEIRNNPGTETCDRSIAESKGWMVLYY